MVNSFVFLVKFGLVWIDFPFSMRGVGIIRDGGDGGLENLHLDSIAVAMGG
jgi:hypothetical protein